MAFHHSTSGEVNEFSHVLHGSHCRKDDGGIFEEHHELMEEKSSHIIE